MKAGYRFIALSLVTATLLPLSGCTARVKSPTADQPTPVSTTAAEQVATGKQPPQNQAPAPVVVDLYPAYVMNGATQNWGYINAGGQFVIAPQFGRAQAFESDGLAVIMQNNRYGLVDGQGKLVVPPTYASIGGLEGGVRLAHSDSGQAAIDSSGAVLFQSKELTSGFSEGLGTIFRNQQYGYVRPDGTVAIEPQYKTAGPFRNGLAVVQLQDARWAAIDTTGHQLGVFPAAYAMEAADGLIPFQSKENRQYGYAKPTGEVAIAPQFNSAFTFTDGYAIVGTTVNNSSRMGLINHEGAYVIPPDYGSIDRLGGGLYALGKAEKFYTPTPYTRKALFTPEGRQLTDYLYYEITRVAPNILCVEDLHGIFFVDDTGAKIGSLPALPGRGAVRVYGDLIQVQSGVNLIYLTKAGKVVWQTDQTVALEGGGKVVTQQYQPDRFTSIYYPTLTGLPNPKAEPLINDPLKKTFLAHANGQQAADPAVPPKNDLSVGYNISQLHNLLIVQMSAILYPVGAAHGMPSRESYHYDLTTGAAYTLADLFRPGADYQGRLQTLVSGQIATRSQTMWSNRTPAVSAKQHFTIQPDGLLLFYYPYEIATYADGFPSFLIPYDQITDLINTDGAFWKAFH